MSGAARRLAGAIYGVWAWLGFLACVVGALLVVLGVPGLARRRRLVSACARWPFGIARIAVSIDGLDYLPAGQCIVVANHASYLDGVILQGWLPTRFSYVIKGEMKHLPVAGFLLRRIGAHFVDRFTATASRDARMLLRAAGNGESLAFFPEGTFIREPGLGPFRAGAFAVAARERLPVVPVVLRGTRSVLPSGHLLPRRGHIDIDVLPPIPVDSTATARRLAQAARQHILDVLDEPDLLTKVVSDRVA